MSQLVTSHCPHGAAGDTRDWTTNPVSEAAERDAVPLPWDDFKFYGQTRMWHKDVKALPRTGQENLLLCELLGMIQ